MNIYNSKETWMEECQLYGVDLPFIGVNLMNSNDEYTKGLKQFIWDWITAAQELSKVPTLGEEFIKRQILDLYCDYSRDHREQYLKNPIDLNKISNELWDRYIIDFYSKNIDKLIVKTKA